MKTTTTIVLDKRLAAVLKASMATPTQRRSSCYARYCLDYVLVRPREIVATNGTSLVAIEMQHTLKPGYYDLKTDTLIRRPESCQSVPPFDYKSVWPHKAKQRTVKGANGLHRDIVWTALMDCHYCMDVWRYEKMLKALDRTAWTAAFYRYHDPLRASCVIVKNCNTVIKWAFMPYQR